MVAVHHEIPGPHAVGIHRAAGRTATAAHVTAGGEVLLAEEFPVGDQRQAPSGQLQSFQLGCALGLERHWRVLLQQPLNGGLIAGVGNKAGDAVVLFQQRHRAGGLG